MVVIFPSHRSSFSTLPFVGGLVLGSWRPAQGRLLHGQRACLSRALYGFVMLFITVSDYHALRAFFGTCAEQLQALFPQFSIKRRKRNAQFFRCFALAFSGIAVHPDNAVYLVLFKCADKLRQGLAFISSAVFIVGH